MKTKPALKQALFEYMKIWQEKEAFLGKLIRRQVTAKHSKWFLKQLRLLCLVSVHCLWQQLKANKTSSFSFLCLSFFGHERSKESWLSLQTHGTAGLYGQPPICNTIRTVHVYHLRTLSCHLSTVHNHL